MLRIRERLLGGKIFHASRGPRSRGEVVDADAFSGKRQTVLRASRAKTLRFATVTVAAISWLAVSNHCALGLATIEAHQSETASAHDCCTSAVPAQPKPAKDPATPCCKTLPALSVNPAQPFDTYGTACAGAPLVFVTTTVARPRISTVAHRFLDTGPPRAHTFAESVLQQSLLAHAPPFLS